MVDGDIGLLAAPSYRRTVAILFHALLVSFSYRFRAVLFSGPHFEVLFVNRPFSPLLNDVLTISAF